MTKDPRILHLTLYRKWWDLIERGEKKIEYRESKPYWRKRLFDKFPLRSKPFDEVHFRNGYGKHRPLVKVKHLWTRYHTGSNKIEIVLGDVINNPLVSASLLEVEGKGRIISFRRIK